MTNEDIRRFARYASVQELFPDTDRRFYEEKLHQSILVKGFQYENIRARQKEFDQITRAISNHRRISFQYNKVGNQESKTYRLAPYQLVNKNGIWYLVGTDDDHRQKTYCFSQIRSLITHDPALQETIRTTDSIYYGNQIKEIIVEISPLAAGYFQRRALLPNQETVRELENGGLLLACKNVNPREVVPIVQYWIPHSRIISPAEIQQQMAQALRDYLNT
ncbi:WYL domain-containing protein [Cardiobacterium hominis]